MTEHAVHKYEPNWESLQAYTVPDWFKDAKFGIFIHWGAYAVPAYGSEWYPRWMYRDEEDRRGLNYYRHHVETWGHPSEFGYKDFLPLFKAEHWDPQTWLDLFQEAGARYVVPVAEHHDGVAMYDTPLSRWNVANMGPRRDIVTELAQATRERGLRFGVSSHRAFNWRYYTYADDFDTNREENSDLYNPPHPEDAPANELFLEHWFAKTKELVDRFEPDVLWFDFGWHFDEFAPYRPQVVAYYYNRALQWGKEVVLQYKDKLPDGVAVLDVERGKLEDIRPEYWQTDTSVSFRSWCYIENDEFKSVTRLVHDLVDIVSKNGNLLLNVGPRPDGTLPDEVVERLQGIGRWLAVNGEAIYGTRPWERYGEGPTRIAAGHMREGEDTLLTAKDIRFTSRGSTLYAICPGQPKGQLLIRSLGSDSSLQVDQIARVSLLGADAPLTFAQDERGLSLTLPAELPCEHAFTVKIECRR